MVKYSSSASAQRGGVMMARQATGEMLRAAGKEDVEDKAEEKKDDIVMRENMCC